ncbi:hypothetical protein GWK47_016104 [Chionoecetes opilio]|uniref:Uncharacterized protein n=1 Tax=Chionoecetes opilio TaxID=41210 RepID=A0A8J4XYH5_CHIOP|nr:hypothetical protein GWK47_016104 [Chionoecetes opilio]
MSYQQHEKLLVAFPADCSAHAPVLLTLVQPDNHPLWAYFYGFVLALVLANIILFCQVAYILIMAQNDPILQRTRQQNRERYIPTPSAIMIIPDVINALQGFSIFLIFICKRNMLKRIRTNWEPYLRRMKVFVGSSRQPDSAKGKGVQDTSSFTSSVNRPISQSNASQRTVQSQISLDTISAVRWVLLRQPCTHAALTSPSRLISLVSYYKHLFTDA